MKKLPIIRYRHIWFLLSGILVLASVVSLAMFELKQGIDFTGGSLLEVQFTDGKAPSVGAATAVISTAGYNDAVIQGVGTNGLIVRLPTIDEAKHQTLLKTMRDKLGALDELRFDSIGPTIGAELRSKAVMSLIFVLVGIATYVAFAFRKVSYPVASWKYGLVTLIAALFHDVLLPLGMFAFLGRFYGVEINSGFVAAILTVLGFSVHDTIVVFDRIRENLLKLGGNFEDVVEQSVNETLARSINTSLAALFPLLAIFFFGGVSLRYFALTLFIGLAAGTYSSIFLAAPLLVVMQKKRA